MKSPTLTQNTGDLAKIEELHRARAILGESSSRFRAMVTDRLGELQSLDELAALIASDAMGDTWPEALGRDALPTFGGSVPLELRLKLESPHIEDWNSQKANGVWSWDKERLLVGVSYQTRIVPRTGYIEQLQPQVFGYADGADLLGNWAFFVANNPAYFAPEQSKQSAPGGQLVFAVVDLQTASVVSAHRTFDAARKSYARRPECSAFVRLTRPVRKGDKLEVNSDARVIERWAREEEVK